MSTAATVLDRSARMQPSRPRCCRCAPARWEHVGCRSPWSVDPWAACHPVDLGPTAHLRSRRPPSSTRPCPARLPVGLVTGHRAALITGPQNDHHRYKIIDHCSSRIGCASASSVDDYSFYAECHAVTVVARPLPRGWPGYGVASCTDSLPATSLPVTSPGLVEVIAGVLAYPSATGLERPAIEVAACCCR
jgi:hypothetical protein